MYIDIPKTVDADKYWKIVEFCKKNFITHYNINQDGSIDILNHTRELNIVCTFMREMPIKINKVIGDLNISGNFGLSSLHNFPNYVGGDLRILANHMLPDVVKDFLDNSNDFEIRILLKYQDYYNVWIDGFNQDAFNDLIMEIKDGLE